MPGNGPKPKKPMNTSGWQFTEHHIRPNVFYYSPDAYAERVEVKTRRKVAMETYKEAVEKIEIEDFVEAENLLEIAIAAWPDNPTFLSALAVCICDHRKDPERSLPWFDSAISMRDSAAYRADRAHALASMGALDEALQDCGSAIAGDPKNGVYMRSRAMIYERMGHFFEAANDYSHAILLLKANAGSIYECIFNRGYCHKLLGRSEEAVDDFENANGLAPFSVAVKVVLGGMHLNKQRYQVALTFFQAAKFAASHSPAASNNMGLTQYLMAMDPEALKDETAKMFKALHKPKSGAAAKEGATKEEEEKEQDPSKNDHAEVVSDDDATWEQEAEKFGSGKNVARNEDPKQWAIHNLQGGAQEQEMTHERRDLLEQALHNFNTALELYNDHHEPGAVVKSADLHAHAVQLNTPAVVKDGLLLILGSTPHIPGTAVVHDDELEDGEIQYNRGLVNLALGKLDEAEADFHAALEANPTHAHFPHYRAVVLARKGELKLAVKWNMSSLNMNARYYPALYHLGLILHLLMRNAEAIQRLDTGLSIHSTSWKIMEARGRVLQELDRHSEAVTSLSHALTQLDLEAEGGPPLRARLHFAIAQSAIASHQRDLLRSSLREAQLNGQDPASMFSLRGLLAHREKKLDKAIKYMSRAIKLAPQEARFLFDRSQVYMESGRFQLAISDMTEALVLLSDCPSLYYHRGMAHYGMDNDELACQDFDAAARMVLRTNASGSSSALENPRPQPPLLVTDARLWEGAKVKSTATAPPDLTASLWYHLGCTRARLGDVAAAAEAFEYAALLLPSHPAVVHELAKSYQAAGQPAKALSNFDKVLKLQPNNANAVFRRGLLHRSLRNHDAASADMQKAKKLEPDNPAFQVDFLRMGDLTMVELCKPGCETAFSGATGLKR